MIAAKDIFLEMINARAREIGARVELFEGSTLRQTFNKTDALKSFTVERIGEGSKFFGFGICQKLQLELLDRERAIHISNSNGLEVEFGVGTEYINPFPMFYVDEVNRDENTNDLTIVAYDRIYEASKHFTQEIEQLHSSYTIKQFAEYCAAILGLSIVLENVDETPFATSYPEGANYEGSESLREALDDIAEATQTIYYINNSGELVFKRLDISGEPVATISKDKYFELKSEEAQILAEVAHVTELGDNITASSGEEGTIQYIRNNPFFELRDDAYALLETALAAVKGTTITPFTCSWRGNFLIEIGDKIALTAKDDTAFNSYLLNSSINYDGGMREENEWVFNKSEAESSNPSTLGEFLNRTTARVDKVNQEVTIAIQKVEGYDEQFVEMELDLNGINATVQQVKTNTNDAIDSLNQSIETLTTEVSTKTTSEEVNIAIQKQLENGVDKVTTSTGFTFNEEGLTVSKTGTDITTTITEDGMIVRKQNEELLVANNEGVTAIDLHAKTYLIIGTNSRIEDFGTSRTGVFWIGG